MPKPRVLFLCAQAPWQRNAGALLRNYWMIDALAKKYAVDLVVADEPGSITPAFASVIDDYASFPRGTNVRGGFGRLARAAMPGESTLTAGWASSALREYVAERLGRYPYAAIQTDLPMRAALPRLDAIPVVYNAHNCESASLVRGAAGEASAAGIASFLDALRVRSQERALIDRAALVTVCAEKDLQDFERFAPGIRAKSAIVANGVDVASYAGLRSEPSDAATVLITGSMDQRPNVLGLRWFLRYVLPGLRAQAPCVVVRVAGRMDSALAAELQRYPNVEAVANPISMEDHLAAATVIAVPVVASSGTRLRILEAWAAGRPVITTTAGAAGLGCRTGCELALRDEPLGFANGLCELLASPDLRSSLVSQAAQRVTEHDWRTIGATLRSAYERVAIEWPRRIETVSEDDGAVLSGIA